MNDDQLRAEMDGTPHFHPNGSASPASLLEAETTGARPVSWLWYPYLPANQISILGAPGGGGKGLNAAQYAACVSTGRDWPACDFGPGDPAHVLWCEAEDPLPEVVVPRLMAAGADRKLITFASRDALAALDLQAFIKERGTRLIIMSPMISFLTGLVDINGELGVRDVLERLQAGIAGTGCAVLGLCHNNKKADLRAIERLLGSVAFANFCRSVLLVGRDKDDPEWFRLVHAKHNLSIKGNDLLYRPVHVGEDPRDQFVRLDWDRPDSNIEADSLFDRAKGQAGNSNLSAADWITAYLEQNGESLRADVVLEGEKLGFKEKALTQAATRSSRINWRRDGFQGPVYWSVA